MDGEPARLLREIGGLLARAGRPRRIEYLRTGTPRERHQPWARLPERTETELSLSLTDR